MNTTLLSVVKQIIAKYGEDVLADPPRLKALFSDLAQDVPKPLRLAFGRCIEAGAYIALKSAADSVERAERKAQIAQRVRDEHGLDMALCAEALDVLEAALFVDELPSCASCGKELQPEWKACPFCGAAAEAAVQEIGTSPEEWETQATPVAPPPVAETAPPPTVKPAMPATAAPSAQAGKPAGNKKETLIAAAVAVGVAAVVAVVLFAEEVEREQRRVVQEQQRIAQERQRLANAHMVFINGGTFTMGSPASEPERSSDEMQHSVTVSSFYLCKYEVTQEEWRDVMGNNPSYFKGDDLPVEQVSWYDVVEYCNERSEMEGLTPAYTINGTNVTWNRYANGYRLPTEAEWEYACRAWTTTPFNTGNNITTNQANYDGDYPYNRNAKGRYRERTWPVGSGSANNWGLYDMHGNVYEWCWDWYGDYPRGAQTDPTGALSGSRRVPRGGSWNYDARFLRSAYRDYFTPSNRHSGVGFRLARSEF